MTWSIFLFFSFAASSQRPSQVLLESQGGPTQKCCHLCAWRIWAVFTGNVSRVSTWLNICYMSLPGTTVALCIVTPYNSCSFLMHHSPLSFWMSSIFSAILREKCKAKSSRGPVAYSVEVQLMIGTVVEAWSTFTVFIPLAFIKWSQLSTNPAIQM